MNYKECYAWGKASLEEAHVAEAALDARLLLEWVCHTTRQDLLVHGERPVSEEEEQAFKAALTKRGAHIPLQHITGEQEFMGLTFLVNDKVLVPRQDTEVLVEEAMRYLHDGMRILDLCTGSGCILLSLLHYSNDCEGVGTDLSSEALKVAVENAKRLGLYGDDMSDRVSFREGDLFQALSQEEKKFDLIVSNPPYIQSDVIPTLMEEVKAHEPMMALDGGEDGLDFYRQITEQAPAHLNGGGMLMFEIGYDQSDAVQELMTQKGFKEVTGIKDFAGNDRVVYGTWY